MQPKEQLPVTLTFPLLLGGNTFHTASELQAGAAGHTAGMIWSVGRDEMTSTPSLFLHSSPMVTCHLLFFMADCFCMTETMRG